MSSDWSNDRRQTTYEEARAVIEAQNDTMADIDDKAMRAVRLITVILGLLVAGLQYDPTVFDGQLLLVSFGSLVVALIAGIVTYDESDLYVGPDGEYIETLAADTDLGERWDRDLAETFAGMIAENYDDIRTNSRYLRVMNLLLIAGIAFAVAAVVF